MHWEIIAEYPDAPLFRTIVVEDGSLYLKSDKSESDKIDWSGFIDLINAVPEDVWCNLYLGARMEPARAIEIGIDIANEAANVYNALAPLYDAAVGDIGTE